MQNTDKKYIEIKKEVRKSPEVAALNRKYNIIIGTSVISMIFLWIAIGAFLGYILAGAPYAGVPIGAGIGLPLGVIFGALPAYLISNSRKKTVTKRLIRQRVDERMEEGILPINDAADERQPLLEEGRVVSHHKKSSHVRVRAGLEGMLVSESDVPTDIERGRLRTREVRKREKRRKERAEEIFKDYPNQQKFYEAIRSSLTQLYIGCSAAASKRVEVAPGNLGKVATGLEFIGDMSHLLLSEVGKIIELALKWGIEKPLESVGAARQENIADRISKLMGDSLETAGRLINRVAVDLTKYYQNQLNALSIEPENGIIVGIKERIKETVLLYEKLTPAEKFAKFCLYRMIGAFDEGQINPGNVSTQFTQVVKTPQPVGRFKELVNAVLKRAEIGTVRTVDGQVLRLEEICVMPLAPQELEELHAAAYDAGDEEGRVNAPVSGPSFYSAARPSSHSGSSSSEEDEDGGLVDRRVAQGDPSQSGSPVLS